jgi:carbamoyltransferase
MNILGISAYYHDSAAALVSNGEIIAAAQEERFTRKKHDASFPENAILYCLEHAGLVISDIDYVVFYEKPLRKFERLLETYVAFAPAGFMSFRKAIPVWVKEKMFMRRNIKTALSKLPGKFSAPLVFTGHHESHAASAFLPSPFEEAAIITVDGVGEWTTTSIARGKGNKVEMLYELSFPHSLGLLYSAFTYYTGFRVNSGEYKLMGLAPYGEPKYSELIEEHLIDIKGDGSFRMNMKYFNYCQGLTMTSESFHKLFGHPPRKPESDLDEFYMDIAASIQVVTEKIMLRIANHAKKITGCNSLCLAGGVALNCVANGKILRDGSFGNVWIQPAAGDAGGALGAALFVWNHLLENPRKARKPDFQHGSYLGPSFSQKEIETFLNEQEAGYTVASSDAELCSTVATLMAEEKVVGWFQGRMEFGPRALGGRSIIGDARSTEMQKVMNLKIKFRESFRPFAPCVLKEKVDDYFEMRPNTDSPYMLLVADVLKEKRESKDSGLKEARGFDKLQIQRSEIQAVTHVDYSARVQTVDEDRHPLYYRLIKNFESLTGCPVIINTSFNVRGEPIVCTPEEAYKVFRYTNMDVLVLGRCVLLKKDQKKTDDVAIREHLSKFALD